MIKLNYLRYELLQILGRELSDQTGFDKLNVVFKHKFLLHSFIYEFIEPISTNENFEDSKIFHLRRIQITK